MKNLRERTCLKKNDSIPEEHSTWFKPKNLKIFHRNEKFGILLLGKV